MSCKSDKMNDQKARSSFLNIHDSSPGKEVKALNRIIFVPVIIAIAILAVYPVPAVPIANATRETPSSTEGFVEGS